MRLILVCVFFVYLLTSIACTSDVMPIMYPIPLQNETVVPEELRHLPKVGKCCPVDEVLVRDTDGNTVCASSNDSSPVYFSPFFSDFNLTGALVPGDEYKTFVVLVGNPCNIKYMLHPEENAEDEYYLLMNGSIFAPRIDQEPIMLMPGEDYCMDVVPELGLRALVCFQDSGNPIDVRVIIYACGLLISVPFLIVTIVAYAITPMLRDVLGKALCHYCGCLALAFATLAITQLASSLLSPQVCVSIAFVIQFSFVACFFWLNVMCIETWSLVRHFVNQRAYRRIQPKTLFFYYSIWAWGLPAVLILVSMVMDLSPTIPMTYVKPTFGSEKCWFKSDAEAMPYFYVPVGLLLLGNLTLFTITAVRISRYQHELALRRLARNQHSNREDRLFRRLHRLRRIFIVCVVLFFLMGLNWIMELISWCVGGDPFDWTAFDLVNALQGVLIFGLFVLRRPIRDIVWHRIQEIRGINTTELNVGSMDLALLPVINGDIPERSFNNRLMIVS